MDAHLTVWSCLASGQSRQSRPPAWRAAPCRHRMQRLAWTSQITPVNFKLLHTLQHGSLGTSAA